jgi:hypothetical protein
VANSKVISCIEVNRDWEREVSNLCSGNQPESMCELIVAKLHAGITGTYVRLAESNYFLKGAGEIRLREAATPADASVFASLVDTNREPTYFSRLRRND